VRIRPEQMKVLGEYSFSQFVKSMLDYLRSNHAKHVADKEDSELRRIIEAGTDKAAAYGIETEDEVRGIIECLVVFGNAFDVENKWAFEIFHDASIGADEKVRLLLEQVQLRLKEN
jgi:hypothetical protein